MHDIYLKTTRVIHNWNNFDFLIFHAASTNFDRGFQKCITKNENLSALFSYITLIGDSVSPCLTQDVTINQSVDN